MTEEFKTIQEHNITKTIKVSNNMIHSFNDQPAIIDNESGYQEWWKDGKRHRENQPAVLTKEGLEMYFVNGIKTRIGKPAVIFPNGEVEFWLEGELYDKKDYFMLMTKINIEKF